MHDEQPANYWRLYLTISGKCILSYIKYYPAYGLNGVNLMSQDNKSPVLDEAVKAWLKKNKAEEKRGFVTRLKIACFVMLFLTAGVLLWRFTG